MANLAETISNHCTQHQISLKALSDQAGVPYPTLVNLVNKGGQPRKTEHRDQLRTALGLSGADWAAVLAASGKDAVEIPNEGPLTVQQLVLKQIFAKGFSELQFSQTSGINYQVLIGITRKGRKPRAATIKLLADKLEVPITELLAASEETRSFRKGRRPAMPTEAIDPATPSLSQLLAERIAIAGVSVAAFARASGIPYMSLQTLLRTGEAPRRKAALEPLQRSLGLSEQAFALSLAKSRAQPTPIADSATAKAAVQAQNPLHAAVLALIQEKHWSTSDFAKALEVSQLTATKLAKQGDLPGRATTHAKLRGALGLAEDAYEALLKRSRPAESEPEEQDPELEALIRSIRALPPEQRAVIRQVVQTLPAR